MPCTAAGVLNFHKFLFTFSLFLRPFFCRDCLLSFFVGSFFFFCPFRCLSYPFFVCFLLFTYTTFRPKIFCDRIISSFFVACLFIRSDVMWHLWGCFIRNVCNGRTTTTTTTTTPHTHTHTHTHIQG
jgi:hypothetical protein